MNKAAITPVAGQYRRVAELIRLECFDEARAEIAAARAHEPDSPFLLAAEIALYHAQRDWDLVVATWDRLDTFPPAALERFRRKPAFLNACRKVGIAHLGRGDTDSARSLCELMTQIDPHSLVTRKLQLEIFQRLHDMDGMLRLLTELCESAPENPGFWRQRIQLLISMGRAGEGSQVLSEAARQFRDDKEVCASLALFAGELNKTTVTPVAGQHHRRVAELIGLKCFDEARAEIAAARAHEPDSPFLLAEEISLYHAQRDWDRVIATWDRLNCLPHAALEGFRRKSAFLNACRKVGIAHLGRGDTDSARSLCELMMQIDPHSLVVRKFQLEILQNLHDMDGMLRLLTELCESAPENPGFWRQRIQLLVSMGRAGEGSRVLSEATRQFRNDTEVCTALALFAGEMQLYANADELLDQVQLLVPDNPAIFQKLLKGFWDLGYADSALLCAHWLKAVSASIHESDEIVQHLRVLCGVAGTGEELPARLIGSCTRVTSMELFAKQVAIRAARPAGIRDMPVHRLALVVERMTRGGAERQALSCLKCLAADAETQFEITLYSRSHAEDGVRPNYYAELRDLSVNLQEYGAVPGADIMDYPGAEYLAPWAELLRAVPPDQCHHMARLVCHFIDQQPDVVHVWMDESNIVAGLAALIAGVPRIILSARGLAPAEGGGRQLHQYRGRVPPYLHACYHYLLQAPNVTLFCNSHAGAASYRSWLSGSPFIPVIHNGVDFDHLDDSPSLEELARQATSLERLGNHLVVGVVTRLVKVKQPLLWIDTARLVHAALPEVRFVMVGYGPLQVACECYAQAAGLAEVLVFAGGSTNVVPYLERIDLFLMTSATESLPNALIEAQGYGVPAVCAGAGGIAEIIEQGLTGWIVEADAASLAARVIACLKDPDWLRQASVAAREKARRDFSTARMYRELKQLYHG